jgi:uncharacterized protein YbaR (Trm112 family)
MPRYNKKKAKPKEIIEEEINHDIVFTNDSFIDMLTCPICQNVLNHATRINCSHTFCLTCINTWIKTKVVCPICRTKILKTQIGKDLIAQKIINSMEVKCTYKSK